MVYDEISSVVAGKIFAFAVKFNIKNADKNTSIFSQILSILGINSFDT